MEILGVYCLLRSIFSSTDNKTGCGAKSVKETIMKPSDVAGYVNNRTINDGRMEQLRSAIVRKFITAIPENAFL